MSQVDRKFITEEMNKLSPRWKEFSDLRYASRCFKQIDDLPDTAITEIVEAMLDNFRYTPLPKDFMEAAVSWRRRFAEENGYAYGTIPKHLQITPEPCKECLDTGYMFCKITEKHPETIAFCYCEIGIEKSLGDTSCMPRWEKDIFDKAYGFMKIEFPTSKFVPKLAKDFKLSDLIADKSVKWWLETKKSARNWWKAEGEKYRGQSV